MTRIGLIAAAAMLVGGAGVAIAQTPSTSPGASGTQGTKCWDSATNQVRTSPASGTMAGGSMAGGSAGTSSGTTTGSTTGSAKTGSSNGAAPSAGAGSSAATGSGKARPAEAMGLPDCKM
jgi:hypothetical protein